MSNTFQIFVVYIGMRFLDFTNRWLEYGKEAVLPFFMLHQPVIIVIAFYVVQWQPGILPYKHKHLSLTCVPGKFIGHTPTTGVVTISI